MGWQFGFRLTTGLTAGGAFPRSSASASPQDSQRAGHSAPLGFRLTTGLTAGGALRAARLPPHHRTYSGRGVSALLGFRLTTGLTAGGAFPHCTASASPPYLTAAGASLCRVGW